MNYYGYEYDYESHLVLFIYLILSLIPLKTLLYFLSNSLFLSVESKTKYLFTPFSSIYPFK